MYLEYLFLNPPQSIKFHFPELMQCMFPVPTRALVQVEFCSILYFNEIILYFRHSFQGKKPTVLILEKKC